MLNSTTKRRLLTAVALVAVIIAGIVSRTTPIGWPLYDKSLGDVLYAMAAYLALVLIFPRAPISILAAIATVACLAVEFLQLTDINTELLKIPVLRWFLGSAFSWHDIGCYVIGIAAIAGIDAFLSRPSHRIRSDS